MSGAPYSTYYSPLNPTFINIPLTTFLGSSGTVPTSSSGYSQYMVQGNMVSIQFNYVFSSVGTGNYAFNLPIAISSSYTIPQGIWNVRYTGGTGKLHQGVYSTNTTTKVNLIASGTFGSTPTAFTSAHPDTGLASGDIVFGTLSYIID
jgi:hypothetical protein